MIYVLNRLITQLIPVMFVASLLVFLVVRVIPGDPAAAAVGENATAKAYQQARERLGLDEPVYTLYLESITYAMTGEFVQARDVPQAPAIIELVLCGE